MMDLGMRVIEAVEAKSMGGSSVRLPEEEGKRLSSVWGRQRAGVVIFGSERLEYIYMEKIVLLDKE